MSKKKKKYSPGTPAPESGQYERVGPRGGSRGGIEVTSTKGKPLPPTPNPDEKYVLKDRTKHKK